MRSAIAVLLSLALATAAQAQDEKKTLSWQTDLGAACRKAATEGKLVLLRQVVCECDGKACAYGEIATRPWFLEDAATRQLVADKCVAVAVHAAPAAAGVGLVDPGFPSPGRHAPLRTLFVTPALHVVHRLDLCPFSSDIAAELRFALRVFEECYEGSGAAREGGDRRLVSLHREHEVKPDAWHAGEGCLASECGCKPAENPHGESRMPWRGYHRGVLWHTGLEEAQALAKKSGRLVLYYQIVGDLNKEGC